MQGVCKVPECKSTKKGSLGFCVAHYHQQRRRRTKAEAALNRVPDEQPPNRGWDVSEYLRQTGISLEIM